MRKHMTLEPARDERFKRSIQPETIAFLPRL